MAPVTVEADGLETRQVNAAIREAIAGGATEIRIEHPAARHSFAVGLKAEGVRIDVDGPAGWYTAGMNDGPHVVVHGNVGWGVGECMMDGRIEVLGHAGSGTAASIRGGSVFVAADTGARAGIAMKGGTLVVGGSAGYMSGFMMQRGRVVICGDAADGLGDSMYEGTIYVGGSIASRGADAEIGDLTEDDTAFLDATLSSFGLVRESSSFTKVVSGRRLWNFSTKEPELWTTAL